MSPVNHSGRRCQARVRALDEIPTLESRAMRDERASSAMAGYRDLVVNGPTPDLQR